MKMLVTLVPHIIFCSNFVCLCIFKNCPVTGMKKGDKALPNIILAGRALLMKMLITLEQYDMFGSNFVYLNISTFPSHWYAKW